MISQKIVYEEWYPGIQQQVYAPKHYYDLEDRPDYYSCKIVYSKTEVNYANMFCQEMMIVMRELKGKGIVNAGSVICIVPNHSGDFSPTLQRVADKIADFMDSSCDNIIERAAVNSIKNTNLRTLNERYEFEKDSMKITNTKLIVNKSVILLDDVKTTGITIMECTKILLAAGAKEVIPVCLGIHC